MVFSFIHSSNIQGSSFILDEKESHHIISVLRLREGSNITLTDGEGNIYHAKIELISKKTVEGKILSIEKSSRNKHFHIHLGLPLIKNNKLKLAIEKSVELGIDEITPIKFKRSLKNSISWLDKSGIQNNSKKKNLLSGSINAWYDPSKKKYSFVYSEINGYFMTMMVFLYFST